MSVLLACLLVCLFSSFWAFLVISGCPSVQVMSVLLACLLVCLSALLVVRRTMGLHHAVEAATLPGGGGNGIGGSSDELTLNPAARTAMANASSNLAFL
jgi:hypothetical protein